MSTTAVVIVIARLFLDTFYPHDLNDNDDSGDKARLMLATTMQKMRMMMIKRGNECFWSIDNPIVLNDSWLLLCHLKRKQRPYFICGISNINPSCTLSHRELLKGPGVNGKIGPLMISSQNFKFKNKNSGAPEMNNLNILSKNLLYG